MDLRVGNTLSQISSGGLALIASNTTELLRTNEGLVKSFFSV